MGNTFNKFAELYDDYCELCVMLGVSPLTIHDKFGDHQNELLKQNNFKDINEAFESKRKAS